MFFSDSNQRPSSSSAMRSSSRSELSGYVNPTFQSSIFSHLDNPLNASNSPQDNYSELRMAAKRKVNRVDRYSHILPTVNEWAPKSTDINNPDAHKQTEINAIAIANKKAELEAAKLREHREQLNNNVKEELKKVEERYQTRLDHKKPSQDARKEHRRAETEYWSEVKEELYKNKEERSEYANELATQMQNKMKVKQAELEKQKTDLRTGFTMKPRKEYDIQEYKDVLKKQIEEKVLRESQEKKTKDNERQERLKELQDQEKMVEHYNQQINLRKTQSALYNDNDSEVSSSKLSKSSAQLKRQATTPTINGKSDWESESLSLIKRKEEQEEHLRTIKNQINLKNAKKEHEVSKKKEEERAITGFNLANHRPKITVNQVAEVLKTQMKEKEQGKKKEVEVKQAEVASRKHEEKAGERVAWQQYEEYCQKKMEMFDRYKKDYSSYAPIKKNKGLMTVKI